VKENPARGSYGTAGAGSLNHFLAVLFARAAALDLKHIAYRGTPAALAELIGGQIPAVFAPTNELVEMHRAGRIRILATSNNERSAFLAGVPTLREAGFNIGATGWHGMFAPANTPNDLVQRLNTLVVAAVAKSGSPGPYPGARPSADGHHQSGFCEYPTSRFGILGNCRHGVRLHA